MHVGTMTSFSGWNLVEEETMGGQPLTREDAHTYACVQSFESPTMVRGVTAREVAAGRAVTEMLGIVRASTTTLLSLAIERTDS